MEMERGEKRGFGESNKREESPSLEGEKSGDDGIKWKRNKARFYRCFAFLSPEGWEKDVLAKMIGSFVLCLLLLLLQLIVSL